MNSQHSDPNDRLLAALKLVSSSTEQEAAPADLERRLVEAFRNRKPAAKRRVSPWLAVAAALVVGVAGVLAYQLQSPVNAVSPITVATKPMVQQRLQIPDEPLTFAKSLPQEAPGGEEVEATEFLSLGYAEPPGDGYQIIRVRMERGSLAQFGMPVNPERSGEPIDADLMIGNDGMPRAVRLITRVSDRN